MVENISKLEVLGAQSNTGIIAAVLVNETHEYECDALIDLSSRSVHQNVFKTLNNACLVYDGALIEKVKNIKILKDPSLDIFRRPATYCSIARE